MNFIFGIVILTVINNCASKTFSTHYDDGKDLFQSKERHLMSKNMEDDEKIPTTTSKVVGDDDESMKTNSDAMHNDHFSSDIYLDVLKNLNDKFSKEKRKQDPNFPFGVVPLNEDDTLLSKRNLTKIPIDQINRSCACGQVINRKIVGGKNTAIENHPWTAQIASKSASFSHFCGGSVISNRHVITAAHCVEGEQPGDLLIRLGRTRSNSIERGFDVQEIRMHHRYQSFEKFDIAILVTTRIINFNNRIQPICLPGPFQKFDKKTGIIAGWGYTKEGGNRISSILQEAEVTILEDRSCQRLSSYPPGDLNDKVVCGRAQGKDTCQGDSGGPLVYEGAQNYILVGITSWGRGCARKEFPGVYTSVVRYVNKWIARNTRNEGLFCSRAPLKNPNK